MKRLTAKYIEEEWKDSDGYWIVLIAGWCDAENQQCHQIHEDTRTEALNHEIEKCNCKDCIGRK